ncbi:MAG: hypothetical protein LCI00_25365 [Chloroflexi bacterium]|nr:hypothetical protein [Chloroflexota bacterium]MCC6894925.1 hypothetical protein [Anaerolineae bacterium]
MNTNERDKRVALCARLISKALEPVGGLWRPFESAAYLQAPTLQPEDVAFNIAFWNSLFSQQPPAAG